MGEGRKKRGGPSAWFLVAVITPAWACDDDEGRGPTAPVPTATATSTGGLGGSGNAGTAGAVNAMTGGTAGGSNSSGGSSSGRGGTAGGGGTAGSACSGALVSGDPSVCPPDVRAAVVAVSTGMCSGGDTACTYQAGTGDNCITASYACCGERWYGAAECPRAIDGSDPACPAYLPRPTDDDPCTDEGLTCGYRPVGPGQQDAACCGGAWKTCSARFDLGEPNCTCD